MSLVIRLRDNFQWDAYEKAVQKILNYQTPVIVTWDLRALTKVPWEHLSKTLKLLVNIEHVPQKHITKSILLLPNKEWKNFLNFIFRLSPPQTPVELSIDSIDIGKSQSRTPYLYKNKFRVI